MIQGMLVFPILQYSSRKPQNFFSLDLYSSQHFFPLIRAIMPKNFLVAKTRNTINKNTIKYNVLGINKKTLVIALLYYSPNANIISNTY